MEYYRGSCIIRSCLYLVALLSIIQPSLCTENYDINDTDFLNPNFEINFSIERFTPDFLEQYTTEDTDGDGLRNLDSNNAGIPNVVEAGPTENDSISPDKRDRPPVTDTDGDGVNDNRDADDDNDGIPDLAEQTSTQDTDNDNVKDVLDLDSDNDGIADVVEAGYADVDPIDGRIDNFVDSDSDGLCDDIDPDKPSPDTDNDGDIDCRDHDSDDDGIPDVIEAGGEDADRDGEIDNFTDNTPIDGLNDSGPLWQTTPTVMVFSIIVIRIQMTTAFPMRPRQAPIPATLQTPTVTAFPTISISIQTTTAYPMRSRQALIPATLRIPTATAFPTISIMIRTTTASTTPEKGGGYAAVPTRTPTAIRLTTAHL